MRHAIRLIVFGLFSSAATAVTTTLVLENFDGYSAPLALTESGGGCAGPDFTELSLTIPAGTQWYSNASCTSGDSQVTAGGANGTANRFEMTTNATFPDGYYDLAAEFTSVTDQYIHFEVWVYIPSNSLFWLQAFSWGPFKRGPEVYFEPTGNIQCRGTVATPCGTYTPDQWNKARIYIDQSGAGTFDFYLNDTKMNVTAVPFRNGTWNFPTDLINRITFSANTASRTFLVDEIRIYKTTSPPPAGDTQAPSITASSGTSLGPANVNPNLSLGFTDTGTGADLDFVQYRFNNANGAFYDFTSDGSTTIGTNLTGSLFSPAQIRITDAHWASVVEGASATLYIRAQDDAGNINTPDQQITVTRIAEKPEISIDGGDTIFSPTVNPHLDLSFSDNVALSTVQYRFIDADGPLYYFTSDGATQIGTSLSGTSYDPSSIKMTTAHWSSLADGAQISVTVYAKDSQGNTNEKTITVVRGEPASSGLTDAQARPTVFSASKHERVRFVKLTRQAEIAIYTLQGRKVFSSAVNSIDGSFSWDCSGHSSGIYLVHLSNANGQRKVLRVAIVK